MAIYACVAWGALVWERAGLPIQRQWFNDGPFVKVEFVRMTDDGRVALMVDALAAPVRGLWAVMDVPDLAAAREALRVRETIAPQNAGRIIRSWSAGEAAPAEIVGIQQWAASRAVDAVVWTALPPQFKGVARRPELPEVIEYLESLSGPLREKAERYVRLAPAQIDTVYRRAIEARFGWTPMSPDSRG